MMSRVGRVDQGSHQPYGPGTPNNPPGRAPLSTAQATPRIPTDPRVATVHDRIAEVAQDNIAILLDTIARLRNALNKSKQDCNALRCKHTDLKRQLDITQWGLRNTQQANTALQAQLNTTQWELRNIQAFLPEQQAARSGMEQQIQMLFQEVRTLKGGLCAERRQCAALQGTIFELQNTINELRAQPARAPQPAQRGPLPPERMLPPPPTTANTPPTSRRSKSV